MALCLTGVKHVSAVPCIILKEVHGNRSVTNGVVHCSGTTGFCYGIVIHTDTGVQNDPNAALRGVEVVTDTYTGQTGISISGYSVVGYGTPTSDFSYTEGTWNGGWVGPIPYSDFTFWGNE